MFLLVWDRAVQGELLRYFAEHCVKDSLAVIRENFYRNYYLNRAFTCWGQGTDVGVLNLGRG